MEAWSWIERKNSRSNNEAQKHFISKEVTEAHLSSDWHDQIQKLLPVLLQEKSSQFCSQNFVSLWTKRCSHASSRSTDSLVVPPGLRIQLGDTGHTQEDWNLQETNTRHQTLYEKTQLSELGNKLRTDRGLCAEGLGRRRCFLNCIL